MAVYLASHAPNSRHALRHALELAARLLTGGRLQAAAVAWWSLEYQHMAALRAALLDATRLDGTPHAPATGNLCLTSVRGVLRECARLGLMSYEQEARARDVKPIPGRRLPAGRMLSSAELTRLFFICGTDPRPAGARDAALLAVLTLCGPRRSELISLDLSDYDAHLPGRCGCARQGEQRAAVSGQCADGAGAGRVAGGAWTDAGPPLRAPHQKRARGVGGA